MVIIYRDFSLSLTLLNGRFGIRMSSTHQYILHRILAIPFSDANNQNTFVASGISFYLLGSSGIGSMHFVSKFMHAAKLPTRDAFQYPPNTNKSM